MGAGSSHAELHAELPSAQQHEGMLSKESETLKTWNPRYAVLADRTLCYHDSAAAAREGLPPRGAISLAHCRVELTHASDTAHPDAICIETPSADARRLVAQRGQTRVYFQAGSVAELRVWLRKLQLASREPWQRDEEAPACALCKLVTFDSLLHRRHHCRRCGCVACEPCVRHTQALPMYAYTEPVRVCAQCREDAAMPVLPPEARAAHAERSAGERERQAELWHVAALQKAKESRAEGADERRARIKADMLRRSSTASGR